MGSNLNTAQPKKEEKTKLRYIIVFLDTSQCIRTHVDNMSGADNNNCRCSVLRSEQQCANLLGTQPSCVPLIGK